MVRYPGYGAELNARAIRAALDDEEWEPSEDGYETRRIYLGSIFSLTPSGKVYVPFACSNVAGDCPVCMGKGTREPRTGSRVRRRAKARLREFAMGTWRRRRAGSLAGAAYCSRVAKMRHRATTMSDITCRACAGMGSISAARDESWHAYANGVIEDISASLESGEGDACDLFVVEYREMYGDEEEGES